MTVDQLIEKLQALPESQRQCQIYAYDYSEENYVELCQVKIRTYDTANYVKSDYPWWDSAPTGEFVELCDWSWLCG